MLTFVIPTRNAEEYLERCLQSIRYQLEPAKIIVVDGYSEDKTLEIANRYGATILHNPYKLAEYGVKQGILATDTELVVVFAADNELPHPGWVMIIEDIFRDHDIDAAWGRIIGTGINKYFELIQNDPLCWFVNRNLQAYAPYPGWNEFEVDPKKPLIWGANGLVYKTEYIKPIWDRAGYLGDNDAFQYMIEQGHNKVAYYNGSFVIHHHVKSIKHCISKWWRNHTQHYLLHKEERNMRWIITKGFYCKVFLWMLYTVFLSLPHSILLAIWHKDKAWLYHYPLSMGQLFVYIRAKICAF